jgi:hypothetical protein
VRLQGKSNQEPRNRVEQLCSGLEFLLLLQYFNEDLLDGLGLMQIEDECREYLLNGEQVSIISQCIIVSLAVGVEEREQCQFAQALNQGFNQNHILKMQ